MMGLWSIFFVVFLALMSAYGMIIALGRSSWLSFWLFHRHEQSVNHQISHLLEKLDHQEHRVLKSLHEAVSTLQQQQQHVWHEHQNALRPPLDHLKEQLFQLDKWHQQIDSLSHRVHGLTRVLDHSTLKGRFGERHLETLLQDRYPSAWIEAQALFPSGVRADYILKSPHHDLVLAIDSKFPLQAFKLVLEHEDKIEYRRDFATVLKKNIREIAEKYIVPKLTVSYAICFVPSDALYLKLVQYDDVMSCAADHKVWICCPQTLYWICDRWMQDYREGYLLAKQSEYLTLVAELKKKQSDYHEQVQQIEKKFLLLRKEFKLLQHEQESLNDIFEQLLHPEKLEDRKHFAQPQHAEALDA